MQAVRPPPDSVLAAVRADPAYRYEAVGERGPGLLERAWAWIAEHVLAPLFRASATDTGQAFWIVVAAAVVAGVGWMLWRAGGLAGLFARREAAAEADADALFAAADLGAVDVAAALRAALAAGEWRAALRLRYLLALQALDRRGLVAWSRDKTNRAYVREATAAGGADLGRAFADVTRAFERAVYGGRAVDAARWDAAAARFDALDALLAAPRPAAPRPAAARPPAPAR